MNWLVKLYMVGTMLSVLSALIGLMDSLSSLVLIPSSECKDVNVQNTGMVRCSDPSKAKPRNGEMLIRANKAVCSYA